MGKTINACGLTCPAPVLLVKDAVEQAGSHDLTVLVDNPASQENVTRFLGSKGYEVTDSVVGGVYTLRALRNKEVTDSPVVAGNIEGEAGKKILILIASDTFGSGDDDLGTKLMVAYLKTLKEIGTDLWQLIFVNGGVKLTTGSSPVLEELQEYEKSGVILLACGTCLEHFNLTEEKKVGGTTNMLDIVMASQLADKVVTLS